MLLTKPAIKTAHATTNRSWSFAKQNSEQFRASGLPGFRASGLPGFTDLFTLVASLASRLLINQTHLNFLNYRKYHGHMPITGHVSFNMPKAFFVNL
jgi:hypothetical protein